MSANFTPDFKGYTGQGAFRFWCQTALPLIYDDSLSYYELLNKMVVYLNNVISDVGNMESNVNALLSAYNQLQDYVNTYFDNLDVQEEINNKLDAMALDGSLLEVMKPYIDPAFDEQNAIIAEQNQTIANQTLFLNQKTGEQDAAIAVLQSRMDTFAKLPTGSVTTDADAELVDIRVAANGEKYPTAGDAVRGQVSDLNSTINDIDESTSWVYKLENKGINETGEISDNDTRLITDFIKTRAGLSFALSGNYEFRISQYDSSKAFISNGVWLTSITLSDYYSGQYPYIRIMMRNSSTTTADITTEEISPHITTNISAIEKEYHIASSVDLSKLKNKLNALTMVPPEYAEYGSIVLSTGMPSLMTNRIRSGYLKPNVTPVTITANDGYTFNIVVYDENFNRISSNTDLTTVTINNPNRYIRIVVKPTWSVTVVPSDFSSAFTNSFDDFICYATLQDINTIREMINDSFADFSLNTHLTGLTSMVWEYQNWVFPQVISYNRIRNSLFFTFTNKEGYSGIARYDYETDEVTKTFLKKNTIADDHNLIAVLMMSNHKLLCAYSGGHNTDNYIFIRIAQSEESIESFTDALKLTSSETTSYSQLFEYAGKIYLFYRTGNNGWSYRISSDYGATWTAETKLVQASHQYYCQFTETTTEGTLRMCCYSNPEQNDTNIRMGYLHLDTMTLYDTDDTTVIGTQSIAPTAITIIVPITTGKLNRLFNAAKTAVGDTKVLYCIFSGESDGEYYVYDNGTNVKVADAGYALWVPKAQLGVAWVGNNQIAVARGYAGKDLIEIYDYSNGSATFNRLVTEKVRGDYGVRTARPMIDNNQKSLLYIQGYFDPNSFYNFTMDAHIYSLT